MKNMLTRKTQMVTYIIGRAYDKKLFDDVDRQKKTCFLSEVKKKRFGVLDN